MPRRSRWTSQWPRPIESSARAVVRSLRQLVFHTEYGTYGFYCYTCAHAGFFIECWRKVLELIQRGVVTAVVVIAAPPCFEITILVWEICRNSASED